MAAEQKKPGRLRWKKGERPKGLARMVAPVTHIYTDGVTKFATVQSQYRPARGWFWYGMGENTHARPVATADEAKQQAQAHVRAARGVMGAPAPKRETPPGKWKVDMPDGTYGTMPGDPPGPASVRAVINGYVYDVEPRTGRLIASESPTGYRLQKFNEDMARRNAGVAVGEDASDRCHAALMGREKCAHFCGAAQCNAGVKGPEQSQEKKHG